MKKLSARMLAARRRREAAALQRAAADIGSQSALARMFDITPQAVQAWLRKGVPLDRCASIELATKGAVQCEELYEDYHLLEQRPYRRKPAARRP